ncbi:DUF637 domain-containing protein [Pectinatus frisingensis]|uniref:DUF637 domain-containing protein n=1 Tax=Pectinatus frisingensis TaxID=865 RepID=UPI001E593792|nr:DUF637 domain-containing protein [Pectinatus frisingensis]
MNVGRDLAIKSLQDTDDYNEHNSSSGIAIATGGTNASADKGKIDSDYQSTADQSGIYAGKDGFDITVGKNTDLKGAVIASTARPDKNKISTDTLTHSDIQNKADYSASSVGVNVNTKPDAKYNEQGITPNIGVPASGKADSTTKSAIANGTIEVRSNPNSDLSNLSRNTDQAVNVLGKIFDKKTFEEKQELARVFGEEAFKAIGELSRNQQDKADIAGALADKYDEQAKKDRANGKIEKVEKDEKLAQQCRDIQEQLAPWGEGGANITALHALVGGLSAELGGGSFASGAVGAGNAEASRNLLKNLSPDLQQWGSAIIGAAAAKVTGNNAGTGATTAISGTVNNDLAHRATGIAKGVVDSLKSDVQGLWNMFANPKETIDAIKDAAGAIYDLGKEQGFGAVFKQIANAVGGEWVSKYNNIQSDFANGNIDENTYDYRMGTLSGEAAYFIATTVPEPEKLSLSPKLVSALGKISKAKDFEMPEMVVTADKLKKVEYGDQYTKVNGKKSLKPDVEYTTWTDIIKAYTQK